MKTTLFIALLYLPLVAFSQIIFEEITTPEDFSLAAVRKSPTGEYFVQAINDRNNIYTSLDGENWTKTALPVDNTLSEIEFFSDGTPLLKGESNIGHLIRRAGVWHDMNITNTWWGVVDASFIKGDTLFVYNYNTFAFSLDKGISFTTVFTTSENISYHVGRLWKFDNAFVLHHTFGASHYLSIFNEDGVRVLFQPLSLNVTPVATYSSCGSILLNDNYRYYLIIDHAPWISQGSTSDIIPDFTSGDNLFSRNGHYYHRIGDTVYKTGACDFNWEVLTSIDATVHEEGIWITNQEEIFLYSPYGNRFVEHLVGSNQWEEQLVNIDYALVGKVNESSLGHQVLFTPNKLFSKDVSDADWGLLNISDINNYQAQYSPNGSLYLKRSNDILVSSDNGEHFTSIELPEGGILNTYSLMRILDDNFIFLHGGIISTSFYTRNNGLDWIPVDVSSPHDILHIKLVDNHILILENTYNYTIKRINLATNEIFSESLGYRNFFDHSEGQSIQDDGTIYFIGRPSIGASTDALYRYQIGGSVEFISATDQLGYILSITTSGNDLFLFQLNFYDLFDGENFITNNYIGLPSVGDKSFTLSDNEYIYALVDEHRVFRSTTPLSMPQFITGTVYHESNGDCLLDNTDATLSNWQIKVESDEYFRIKSTDSQGRFSFSVPNGEYTVSAQPINANWSLCESSFTVAINDNATVNQDMLAQGLVDCAALELDFSTPLLRRCFDNYYSVRVRNTPISSAGTVLRLELDPFFDFSSASIPYIQMGDILEFDLGVLAVNDQIVFTIFFNLSCDADLGAEHCLSGLLIDANLCPETTTATYKECQVNIGSFDPNDKRIFNEAGYEVETVDKDQYIYYHIRFQNTGTDTAFTVRILDSLSSTLDLNTLEMLSASHPYDFTIKDGPALEVIFKNILLPDSTTNEVASHGFVKFKIKPLPAFDYGTTIPNQAGIYFDFNQPVITNEAVLVIQRPVSTKEAAALIAFSVFPNPTDNTLSLRMTETDRSRIDTYEIINQLGQPMSLAKHLTGNHIAVSHLPSGVYHLALKENGVVIGREKFIKL